jgi:hypothetical protein
VQEDGARARHLHGDQRIEQARRNAPLGDEASETRPGRERFVKVDGIAVACHLGVELDLPRSEPQRDEQSWSAPNANADVERAYSRYQ